jgi:tetratricopeptide (TPR) repeat protein
MRTAHPLVLIAITLTSTGLALCFPPGDQPAVPQFQGLGSHSRPVSKIEVAQKLFDQGLAFLYAFNHDEAIRSFEAAARLDADCAMAYWGIAYANGLHINKMVVEPAREKAALAALAKADKAQVASLADRALIAALAKRYADPAPADRAELNKAYSDAMQAAWKQYPNDADVGALFAESMMNLRPWDLWTNDGQPQPGTNTVTATLDAVLKLNPKHPLALHLSIHAWEASPTPDRAVAAADGLRELQPGLGHMVHMPSHIDVRTGQWAKAIVANEKAIAADAAYRAKSPKQEFYRLYMAHNYHMLAFAAMMKGESKRALDAVRTMLAGVPPEWVAVKENAAIADGFLAAPLEVMMRFGKWDDILKEPEPPELFPIARTLRHHARAVAYAAKGDVKAAREEQDKFREAAKRTPKEATFGNNVASDLYAVAEPMLEGEILTAEGKLTEAIASLRLAVTAEEKVRYSEPPDWIVPVRHPLGAVLLKNGNAPEAEAVYLEDLKKWPNNGWSLYGLSESLRRQGNATEAAAFRKKFEEVWKGADLKIGTSCLCINP